MRRMTWTKRVAMTAAAASCAAVTASALVRAQATRTVWDGVYTDVQAERARATFDGTCSRCHTLTPGGASGQGGSLVGDKFWTANTQKSVGDLLAYISKNMPNGNGGSLSASAYNDLVALVLKSNGFPSGAAEVSPVTVADVQIIPRDGAGELPANVLARVVGCLKKDGSDWLLMNATSPERTEKTGPVATDATRPLR